jgi:hypothetical protein
VLQSRFDVSQNVFDGSRSGFDVYSNRFALPLTAVQVRLERFGALPERPAALLNRLGASLGGRSSAPSSGCVGHLPAPLLARKEPESVRQANP